MNVNAPSLNPAVPAEVTILMYHGLRRAGFTSDRDSDPVYELTQERFARQLELVASCGAPVTSLARIAAAPAGPAAEGRAVVLSFDDGIACQAETVVPMLLDHPRALVGEFFVSAELVGKPGYISWAGLRDMLAAGMSVQSHGGRHRYLTELSESEAAQDLARSRRMLEDGLGTPVRAFSAPGGRITPALARIAHGLGYAVVCGSRPGYWQPASKASILPRMAVRANTADTLVNAWVHGSRRVLWRDNARYCVLGTARAVLGNGLYDRIRARFVASPPSAAGQAES